MCRCDLLSVAAKILLEQKCLTHDHIIAVERRLNAIARTTWKRNPPTDFPNYAVGAWGAEAATSDHRHWFSSDYA
jgi:hypothetical protein